MWLIFALLTTIAWGSADLFYKKGSDSNDKYSHIKIVIMVGLVMGIHGFWYIFSNHLDFSPVQIIRYFPVSLFYILSMTLGYIGLRYIELSISSPVQNSSGAITAMLLFIFFKQNLEWLEILAIIIISTGVFAIALLEKKKENEELASQNIKVDPKYQIGFLAIIFPILYCIIDGLGTFADAVYLDEMALISENDALLAYEFTFFIFAVLAFLYYTVIKKQKFSFIKERVKGIAAIFETIGQFFYVFAMSGSAIISAPLISSYSIVSIILSRIFLKEKLTKKQYLVILYVIVGIILLGVSEEL
jgi:drug/metabolite transporter (DMT)-like permease